MKHHSGVAPLSYGSGIDLVIDDLFTASFRDGYPVCPELVDVFSDYAADGYYLGSANEEKLFASVADHLRSCTICRKRMAVSEDYAGALRASMCKLN